MFLQWPALDWCPDDYDPRRRPWYAAAATMPKDVAIVIDFSGSMINGPNPDRWPQAQQAVNMILDTMYDYDFATLIGFSEFSHTGMLDETPGFDGKVLLRMDEANKKRIRDEVNDMYPTGGTDFTIGLQEAFDVLTRSSEQSTQTRKATSGCSSIILFMTDGIDNSQKDVLGELRTMQQNYKAVTGAQATLFTYAFGEAVSSGYELTKKMACQNAGFWYEIPDAESQNLGKYMSDYFMYFGSAQEATEVRWVQYTDAGMGAELIAGCLAAYDKSPGITHISLMGVVCMDMNVLLSMDELRSKSDYKRFKARIEENNLKCWPLDYSALDLQRLRGENQCRPCDLEDAPCPQDKSDDYYEKETSAAALWGLALALLAAP